RRGRRSDPMPDDCVIAGPVGVVHLARLCPEKFGRYDLEQVRFGRLGDDLYALSSDSKVLAAAVWPADDRTTAPAPREFGVPAELLAPVAELVRRKAPWRAWGRTVLARQGGVTVECGGECGIRHRLDVSADPFGPG